MIFRYFKERYIVNKCFVYFKFLQQFFLLRLFKIKCYLFTRINYKNKKHFINEYKSQNNKVCHIIGSGYSLDFSKNKIKSNDFVIGFNFAALEKLNFDLYFFEFAGSNCRDISIKQREVLNDLVLNKKRHLYFINFYIYNFLRSFK